MNSFKDFSVFSIRLIQAAAQISAAYQCNTVTATHLLLAITREDGGRVKMVLTHAGYDLSSLDCALVRVLETDSVDPNRVGQTEVPQDGNENPTLGPDLYEVIEHARNRAQFRDSFIYDDDLLSGILQLKNSVPSLELQKAGITVEGMWASWRQMLEAANDRN